MFLTAYVVWLSLSNVSLLRAGEEAFVGLDNYVRFFSDARAMSALWRTVAFTALVSALCAHCSSFTSDSSLYLLW